MSNSSITTEDPILVFAKRPFGISAPGSNSTNFIDKEIFLKLKMNHETICYANQKINGEQKKVVGTVTVTTRLVENSQVSKSLRFHAKIIRNLGCDAQANVKLWRKCGMSLPSEPKREEFLPETKPLPSQPTSNLIGQLSPINIEEGLVQEEFSNEDGHENHYSSHDSTCYEPWGCQCSFPWPGRLPNYENYDEKWGDDLWEENDYCDICKDNDYCLNCDEKSEIYENYDDNCLYDEADMERPGDHDYLPV